MSDNKTEKVENQVDLSKSFCAPSGETTSCCVDKSCAGDENNECPGGVCQLPKKGVKSSKRKMRSPSAVSSPAQPTQLDQLFSQLFSSVLRPPEEKQDCKPSQSNSSSNEDKDSDSDSDHDKDEDDEDDEDDNVSCDDPKCKIHGEDPRWEVMRRLLESHINLTRAVLDLIHNY